jgi:uncharacterized OB-fold protein
MTKEAKIPRLKCLRCGHEWIPTLPRPRACPACKNYKWDTLPEDKKAEPTEAATK